MEILTTFLPVLLFFQSKSIQWLGGMLVLFLLCASCQRPDVDAQLFSSQSNTLSNPETLVDTAKLLPALQTFSPARQVDSLLILADQLKGYDPSIALVYADCAYGVSTEHNWTLQRAISLYYIALMKRRLQTWGGGIEDALADAEISRLLFERLGREDWLVRVYDLMGIIHFRQYEPDRPLKLDTARAYFQRALNTLESTRLGSSDSIALMAEILHDFGTTYEVVGDSATARKFFNESFENYRQTGNKIGLARLRLSIGNQFLNAGQHDAADSIVRLVEKVGLENDDRDLLSETYHFQSLILLQRYRKTRSPQIFDDMIGVIQKRLQVQKEDKYHSYAQMGLSFQSRAAGLYMRSISFRNSNPDSAQWYFDQAYTQLDTALSYYKIAMDEAQNKGVLTAMDNLTYNIFTNCVDKQVEGKGNCKNIFGEDVSKYLRKGYKQVADLMTLNLTQANRRIREMEKLESERMRRRQGQQLISISLIALLGAGLIFLLFLRRAEQKKLKAKMEALRAQINPHFISNSLNAIENLVNQGKNQEASSYLIHFSRLTRRILNSSRNPETTLKEELQTLKHFLKIEQLRFRDKLSYEMIYPPDLPIDQILVPAMILQPYLENAILHGIKPKSGLGQLIIRVSRDEKSLICEVEDDGIGRMKSRELKANSAIKHRSHGMNITEERLKATGKVKGVHVEILDLVDEQGKANGTRVVLRLPLMWKERTA